MKKIFTSTVFLILVISDMHWSNAQQSCDPSDESSCRFGGTCQLVANQNYYICVCPRINIIKDGANLQCGYITEDEKMQ